MAIRKIFVAGHNGMVGSSICRKLKNQLNVKIIKRLRSELDLCDQKAVSKFMEVEKPDEIIVAAAKVGGIHANNTYPSEFIYENLQIQNNIIHNAFLNKVKKLLFIGSSCIYPKHAKQPINENALLTDKLEITNEPYAIAKIAGIKLCESYNRQFGTDYRSVMPTNLYGPGDNYHQNNGHVIPALIRRFHEAKVNQQKEVTVWGTGYPKREFLYIDDMAEASLFVHELDYNTYQGQTKPTLSQINIGTGIDVTIRELAHTIADIIGFKGELIFDIKRPDGTPRKLLSVALLKKLGWEAKVSLLEGLNKTYEDFLQNYKTLRH